MPPRSINPQIAGKLEEMAELLELQGANPFRVKAYRRAAETLKGLERDVQELLEAEGHRGLQALPGIGEGIATAISEMAATGRWGQLERLRGTLDAEELFRSVPGIGPGLARAIHETLHVDTLEALEAAAFDGRLAGVKGLGRRRVEAIRAALAAMLRRTRRERQAPVEGGPGVDRILAVDHDYRARAEAGSLPTISPRRFNPEGVAWLPIMHAESKGWHFTAMYSNTALAHRLGRTRDWVVVYFYNDHHQEGQHTVVTETRGPLTGRRVVRGRELECRRHYAAEAAGGNGE